MNCKDCCEISCWRHHIFRIFRFCKWNAITSHYTKKTLPELERGTGHPSHCNSLQRWPDLWRNFERNKENIRVTNNMRTRAFFLRTEGWFGVGLRLAYLWPKAVDFNKTRQDKTTKVSGTQLTTLDCSEHLCVHQGRTTSDWKGITP